MKKIIVTAGEKYNDIDAFACAVSYSKLLNLLGKESEVVLSGPLNESITNSVKNLNVSYKTHLDGDPLNFDYVLVDISNHNSISKFVPIDNIIEVYDHRWGFEDFWKNKSKIKVVIDQVGSCATLIWEKYKELGKDELIDSTSANLLYTAILSNTLNLKAQITNARDLKAFEELKDKIDLPVNWKEIYFNEVAESFLNNPVESIKNDTKVGPIKDIEYYIMQVELWDSRSFISKYEQLVVDIIGKSGCKYSFLTSPSISEGKNYLIATDELVKLILNKTIGAVFNNNIGTTDKLWLRKEIIREITKL